MHFKFAETLQQNYFNRTLLYFNFAREVYTKLQRMLFDDLSRGVGIKQLFADTSHGTVFTNECARFIGT